MKLFTGIDVRSEKLDVCFLTDDDQLSILSEISIANDIDGASLTRKMILEFDEDKTDRNDALRITDFLRIQRFTILSKKRSTWPCSV